MDSHAHGQICMKKLDLQGHMAIGSVTPEYRSVTFPITSPQQMESVSFIMPRISLNFTNLNYQIRVP